MPRERPRTSVVIVGWMAAPHLRACLDALWRSVGEISYEVLVALNEPTKELAARLRREVAGITVLKSSVNLGFASACNRAVARSRGEFVLLLNDDVLVEADCLETLMKTIEAHPEAGAVGSKFLYPDGRLQEAGAVLWSDGSVFQVSHLVRPNDELVNELRRCDYCSGATLLVRRSTWDEVGGFDEGFYPAYYEDVDLCLKMAARGIAVLYEPRSVVRHAMGSSASLRYREFLVDRNRQRIVERWPEILSEQEPRPEPVVADKVLYAAAKANARPLRREALPLPRDVRLDNRASSSYMTDELDVMRSFVRHLDEKLATCDAETGRRTGELAQKVQHLEQEVRVRDGYLARAQLQIEDLARAREEELAYLRAVLNRKSYQMIERATQLARHVPGAETAARKLLHLPDR